MNKGFTLVETIIALCLTVVIFGAIFGALGAGIRSWRAIVKKNSLAQIETNLAERLTSDIRSASQILSGSTSQEMFIKVGTDTVSYCLISSKVRRRAGSWSVYLTSEGEIERFSFNYPEPGLVRVTLNKDEFTVGIQ